jgi:hypothetical protein
MEVILLNLLKKVKKNIMDDKDLEELVLLAEKHRIDKARLKGSIDAIVKNLKDKGCKSLLDAKKKLEVMNKDLEKLLLMKNKKINEFREKYAKYLS